MYRLQKSVITLFGLLFLLGNHLDAQEKKDNRFEVSKHLEIFNALVKEVEMFYVDTVDVEKTVRRGIDAMLGGLDPYTEYYPEQDMDQLQFMTTGEYGGIGSYIRERKEGGVYIVEPFEGMPAALAGLKAGDRILAVDTVDVTKASSDKVSSLLKGTPNTKLILKVQSPYDKKPRKIELVRKQILENQVTYYGVRGDGVGYIYLKGFTDKSTQEVKNAFEDLKKNHQIKSLVLDLRNNGGGLLESATQIVGMFVPKGKEVVSTKSKISQWDRTYRTANEPLDTVMPMAILINGGSASAAEIVSGALQDMDRAVLIGQRSFGKGLVQSTRSLPYNGNLKVTMSKYYIPSGRCIQQMDYSHRNPDGSVGAIPDSLTSVFYTAKGRPVRDGGGITPDIKIEEPEQPTLMFYLMTDFIVTDFVAEWSQKHKKIAPPETFKQYAKAKNFTYDRQSEKILKNLKGVAKIEGFLEQDSTLFDALSAKLIPDLERDFDRNKERIKEGLASEIMKRYYYQKGDLIQSLRDDKVLEKALEVLHDPALYEKTLSAPVEI